LDALDPQLFGRRLAEVRHLAGLTQTALAQRAGIHRIQIVRMEAGQTVPRLDESLRLAEVLKVPLERLIERRWSPPTDLRGIAIELYHLGIRDLEVTNPQVPGSFRHVEEVLVLALEGNHPPSRVVEAIPYVLAQRTFHAWLVDSFATLHDSRVRTRLAWLSEITLALSRLSTMPVFVGGRSQAQLDAFVKFGSRSSEPDSLGHPSRGNLPPIWRRWNITYAGTLQDFLQRTIEVDAAFQSSRTTGGAW
jgi:transcriptional regulator with XRE-family HTH domain